MGRVRVAALISGNGLVYEMKSAWIYTQSELYLKLKTIATAHLYSA